MRRYSTLSLDDFPPTLIKRFWSKVPKLPLDQCWEWTGSRLPELPSLIGTTSNYGRISIGRGRTEYAHRISFVLHTRQSIPARMVVMHTCDNPPCCNPRHLRLGTFSENSIDRERKGRGGANRGLRSGTKRDGYVPPNKGKFILADRLDTVADLYEEGMTATEIASHFGVGLSTAKKAIRLAGVKTRGPGRRSGQLWYESQGIKRGNG